MNNFCKVASIAISRWLGLLVVKQECARWEHIRSLNIRSTEGKTMQKLTTDILYKVGYQWTQTHSTNQ